MPYDPGPARPRAGRWLTAAALLAIAALTLAPQPQNAERVRDTPLLCLLCGPTGAVDAILNVLLFVPYGFGLRLLGWSWRRILVTVALTTIAIESLQMEVIAGRDASLSDVLTNTTGGLLGAWLATGWRLLLRPAPRAARTLVILGSTAWLAIFAATGWLLERSVPGERPYRTKWAPDVGSAPAFRGRVLAVTVDSTPLPDGPVQSGRTLMADVVADSMRFDATVVSGPPTARRAPVVAVYTKSPWWVQDPQDVLRFDQDGRDLVFRLRMRTAEYKLRTPIIRLADAFPAAAGDTVRLTGAYGHDRLWIRSAGPDGRIRASSLGLSPSWGWTLVLPFDWPLGPEEPWLTALWIAGLLVPLAYLARRAAPGRVVQPWLGIVLATVGLGLFAVPLAVRLPPVDWSEWAAAAAGVAVGSVIGGRTLRRRPPRAAPVESAAEAEVMRQTIGVGRRA